MIYTNPAPYLESTLLKLESKVSDIMSLYEDAKKYLFKGVCILPRFVSTIYKEREVSNLVPPKIITVVGFPLGLESENLPNVLDYVDEVDMVMNVGAFLDHLYWNVKNDILMVRNKIGNQKVLKVIIETTKLEEKELIEVVKFLNDMPINVVKTNTGFFKDRKRCLEEDVQIIKEYTQHLIKASGGIDNYLQVSNLINYGVDFIGTSNAVKIEKEYLKFINEEWRYE